MQRFDERVKFAAQRMPEGPHACVEIVPAVFRQHHLLQRARPAVALDGENAAHQRPAGHEITDAQRGSDGLGERADVREFTLTGRNGRGYKSTYEMSAVVRLFHFGTTHF
jgi:hypothetical protein